MPAVVAMWWTPLSLPELMSCDAHASPVIDPSHLCQRVYTPTTVHFDTLGRPFLTVARNRVVCAGHDLDGSYHWRSRLL
jgi:hypothetical protein